MHWERVLVWTLSAGLLFVWTLLSRRLSFEAVRRRRERTGREA